MSKEYPVDIYPKPNERIKDSAERIYDLGFEQGRLEGRLEASNPLAGWSNLTEAIADGERIDWDALDGIEAKCVHPELGTLTHKLEHDGHFPPAKYSAWYKTDCPTIWLEALISSWLALGGWTLYIKGDLPLRKQTADQLALGTIFIGKCPAEGEDMSPEPMFRTDGHVIAFAYFQILQADPSEVEVYKVVGQLKTPKENA